MFSRKLWCISLKRLYITFKICIVFIINLILINRTATTSILQQQLQVVKAKRVSNIVVTCRLVVKEVAIVTEFWVSTPGQVKLNTVSPTARYCCDFFSELCCPGPKSDGDGPRHWLLASLSHHHDNEDLIFALNIIML